MDVLSMCYYCISVGAGDQAAARADIQPHSQKWAVEGGGKVKLTRRNSTTSVTTDFKLGEPVEETLLEGCASTKVRVFISVDSLILEGTRLSFHIDFCDSKKYLHNVDHLKIPGLW